MSESILVSEIKEHVCTVTLNRPEKKNALSMDLRDELTDVLNGLAAKQEVKVVVLTGSGDIFSAGFDLKEFKLGDDDPEFKGKLWVSSDRLYHTLLFYPLPLVAAVNGPAIAGAFDLVTACDMRIASSNAYFSHPETTFIEVMVSLLHELVGGAVARELCLTGRKVEAEEALSLNLVSSVVPRDELESETARLTGLIARAPRENLVKTKAKFIRKAGIAGQMTLDL
ncbi:MAG: enoyl-CoA hydratase/isomerase family protein [Proteobacteria bacterium]|nr:enoyl-CoA hydratase/isomerase family protein [Pseudomonadota bacterium]